MNTAELKKVLIVQTAYIGDVILITPLIRATKSFLPSAVVDVMVIPQTANILDNNPHIDSKILFDKRKNKLTSFLKTLKILRQNNYDIVLSPHSSLTTALLLYLAKIPVRIGFARWAAQKFLTHRMNHLKGKLKIEKNLHLLTAITNEKFPIQTELFPTKDDSIKSGNLISELKNKCVKIIAVAPGSNWYTKRWPLEYYKELIEDLSKNNYGVVFIGSSEERSICEKILPAKNYINFCGVLSLLESAAVVEQCDLMICNDSGAMHIANAVKTDVIAFFGPTVKSIGYSPIGANDYIFEKDLDCRPCSSHGTKECPLKHHNCMRLISSSSVFQKVNEHFGIY